MGAALFMYRIGYLIGAGLLAIIDYFIKEWVLVNLQPVKSIDIISNVLSLTYHENRGAAFGILQGQTFFLVGVTSVVMGAFIVGILSKKINGHLLLSSCMLILGGGLGNLYDRVARTFVVDYIYFEPINFPIFNFADMCVVVGTALLMIYILFFDNNDTADIDDEELFTEEALPFIDEQPPIKENDEDSEDKDKIVTGKDCGDQSCQSD